ncbi:MAG: hypothetical protein AB1689_28640, partial [Thermodesulfobacteriota bacterium]
MKSHRSLDSLLSIANLVAAPTVPSHLAGPDADAALLADLERRAGGLFPPGEADLVEWRRWARDLETKRPSPVAAVPLERERVILGTPEEVRDTARALYGLLDSIVGAREAHEQQARDAAAPPPPAIGPPRRYFHARFGETRVILPGAVCARLVQRENEPPGALRIELAFGPVVQLLLSLEALPDARYVKRCPVPGCARFFFAWRKDQGACSPAHRARMNNYRHKLRAVRRAEEQAAAQA